MTENVPADAVAQAERTSGGSDLLAVNRIVSGYRGAPIVRGVSLHVSKSSIVAIVGPNGSGKSTLIKSIFGVVKPSAGSVTFRGQGVTGRTVADHLRDGMAYVPQLPSVFPGMTVEENLEMGLYCMRGKPDVYPITHAYDLFPQLATRRRALARTLSGGERRMLEISRSMLLRPSLLLLDEPSVGLSPALTKQVFSMLTGLRRDLGVGMLVVEQNAKTALDACDHGIVLVSGRVAYAGKGKELLADGQIRHAFLGGSTPPEHTRPSPLS